jgi:hypothetical protein
VNLWDGLGDAIDLAVDRCVAERSRFTDVLDQVGVAHPTRLLDIEIRENSAEAFCLEQAIEIAISQRAEIITVAGVNCFPGWLLTSDPGDQVFSRPTFPCCGGISIASFGRLPANVR